MANWDLEFEKEPEDGCVRCLFFVIDDSNKYSIQIAPRPPWVARFNPAQAEILPKQAAADIAVTANIVFPFYVIKITSSILFRPRRLYRL
jgi:hypothetical protein